MDTRLNCVMVVDDDEPTNFFTNMILEESGCVNHIRIMQSGQEALDYLQKCEETGDDLNFYQGPDLIFLDINMPAMDGWEFLAKYKTFKTRERVIVVMLTTSLFPEDKLKAAETPEISGFESKPLTVEKLNVIVEKYFKEALKY